MSGAEATSRGVDELIARLRTNGVEAGKAEAERLVAEAKAEAARLVAEARRAADSERETAKRDADNYVRAGKLALETAMRDAVQQMRGDIMRRFRGDVRRLVSAQTVDPDVLKRMILELAGRGRERVGEEPVEVILPAEVIGPEQIREKADDIRSGELTGYVLGLTGEMLREGVTLRADSDLAGGVRVRVMGEDVEIDLSEEAVADMLMDHLQPRFRAVMDGVIRG
ncbi:MAG: hypothetical protein AAFU80_23610 [Pseudomonadota bacterium]